MKAVMWEHTGSPQGIKKKQISQSRVNKLMKKKPQKKTTEKNQMEIMIRSCDYCFAVFEQDYWSWCLFSNEDDNTFTTLCSECANLILHNQKEQQHENTITMSYAMRHNESRHWNLYSR